MFSYFSVFDKNMMHFFPERFSRPAGHRSETKLVCCERDARRHLMV